METSPNPPPLLAACRRCGAPVGPEQHIAAVELALRRTGEP